jgi:predicted nucleic acid-binding protein
MSILLDTNILLRMTDTAHMHHKITLDALASLRHQGEQLYIAGQNLIEFWCVYTRPLINNGFGRTPSQAMEGIEQIQSLFSFLPDTSDIYTIWKELVSKHGISGARVHDARLIAVMLAHDIDRFLTFNIHDFNKFSGITALTPMMVADRAGMH